MKIGNTANEFGALTRLLHWIIGLLIIFLIWLGWYMVDLSFFDPWYNSTLAWHKALGMIVLALAVIKIGWQLYSPAPALGGELKPWERAAARGMHRLLIGMMILIPLTGYFISTSDGKPVEIFGWFSVPAVMKISEPTRDLAIDAHFYLAYATVLLVIGHAGAAFKHQFVNRDGTLTRILWG
jgi:cytochrome b561